MSRNITSPVDFFGHQLGADRKIARWDKIVEYFYLIESESDRLKVINMGPSTEGQPFLAVIISAPENLARLDYYKAINQQITDPGDLTEEEVEVLVAEGKAIIVQSMSLHASEIGGTQMAPEMAYDMAVSDCPDNLRILENVIYVMVPCFNPDGQLMIADWYQEWLGTEYEGCSMPWLYHKYCGHDNNRDAFALNLVESQYMAQLVFKEYKPHAYQDHHHMGSYGARFFIAPYCDPIRPFADPLTWRELSWYGAHMAYKLEENEKQGILNDAQYPAWGHFGFHWITNHHNIAGMLSESASANLASPKYIDPTQLIGSGDKSFPTYQAQTNFPNPWPGGWWRLRDIVEQQKIAAVAINDIAARNRKTVLLNAYHKAVRQTYRGSQDEEYAYIIPAEQHDRLTVRKLIQLLLNQGIKVERAIAPFCVGPASYPAGTYLVKLGQPKMGVVKNLLGRTLFPSTWFTTKLDGTSMAYDSATDTVAEYMGVTAIPSGQAFEGCFTAVEELEPIAPVVSDAPAYLLDTRLNDSYLAVNKLMAQGLAVERTIKPLVCGKEIYPAGMFVTLATQNEAQAIANETGVAFIGVAAEDILGVELIAVEKQRIGLFQRYWGGNADEGWTRLVLENFGFDYTTIMDADIKAGNLNDMIDVLIIPSDEEAMFVDVSKATSGRAKMMLQWFGDTIPEQYQSGVGEEGLEQIRQFVNAGGKLLTMNKSVDIAINAFKLKVLNMTKGKSNQEYLTHGSTLWTDVDNTHPLAYGMPAESIVFNWDSPVLKVDDRFHAEQYEIFMRYASKDVLQSGQLNGEKLIADQAVGITVQRGAGSVTLLAISPQYRAQTHGTFKLLFNHLL